MSETDPLDHPHLPKRVRWALSVLTDSHTRDDDLTGFKVMAGPVAPWVSWSDYIEAWRIVRMVLSRNVNPSPTPNPYPATEREDA